MGGTDTIMKKSTMVFAAIMFATLPIAAATETVNGITWTYTVTNGVASVGSSLSPAIPMSTSGSITIPSTLGGYPVTSIGDFAFGYCETLAHVTISDGVTSIGDYAFIGCSCLTSVTIPNSVTNIGNYAFYGCSGLTHVIFKGNAPMVGSDAFYDVKSGCAAYVRQDSMGWGVDIPGRCNWNGLNITYLTPEAELAVANEAGSGTVEVDAGELVDVELASGVALMVMGENLGAAALAAKITPKPHEDGQAATLFKVKSESISGGVLLTAVLDEDAVDPETTVAEIVDRETVAAFGAAADGETVSVPLASAKSGLYYGIAVARDPSQLDAAAANVSLVRAGDAGATVPVTKPPGGAAFFKVVVSDRAR